MKPTHVSTRGLHPKLDIAALERDVRRSRQLGFALGAFAFVVLAPLGANYGKYGQPLIAPSPTMAMFLRALGFVALLCGLAALFFARRAQNLSARLPRPTARPRQEQPR